MRYFLVILVFIFSACSDGDNEQMQQTEVKIQNDTLDSSKTIKPSNPDIIDEDEDSSADANNNTSVDANNNTNSVASAPVAAHTSEKQVDAKALYAKCAVCHGAKGEKVAPGSEGNVLISKLSKESIISDLKGYRAKTLKKGKSSAIMYLQSANLSDADIESLGEYISSFNK